MPASSLTWTGYTHKHHEKTSDWYWALGTIAVSCALTAVIFGNVLFALLIVVASVALGMVASREPTVVEFQLNEKGITTGETFHAYDEINAFWVDTNDDAEPVLLLDTVRFMTPHLVIPINDVDPEEVREFLSHYADEAFLQEPLSHRIFEFFGF